MTTNKLHGEVLSIDNLIVIDLDSQEINDWAIIQTKSDNGLHQTAKPSRYSMICRQFVPST